MPDLSLKPSINRPPGPRLEPLLMQQNRGLKDVHNTSHAKPGTVRVRTVDISSQTFNYTFDVGFFFSVWGRLNLSLFFYLWMLFWHFCFIWWVSEEAWLGRSESSSCVYVKWHRWQEPTRVVCVNERVMKGVNFFSGHWAREDPVHKPPERAYRKMVGSRETIMPVFFNWHGTK